MVKPHCNERGNALFLILIAVVLFAALSYAITQSNRGGAGATKEVNSLAASTILQYTSSLATGYMRLQLRGYSGDSYDGIQFMGPTHPQYGWNQDAAKVNVIHPDGGGAPFMIPSRDWVVTFKEPNSGAPLGNWIPFHMYIKGVGAPIMDNVIMLEDVKESVCKSLNFILSGDATIPTSSTPGAGLQNNSTLEDPGNVLLGQSAYCFKLSDVDKYYFYQVLGQDDGGTVSF